MKINELFKIQATIENQIIGMTNIEEDALGTENVLNIRMLALQVKLGELANLTKCYKYSAQNKSVPKGKVLFRYLEGMKYLLSLGNKYQLNIIDDHALDNINVETELIILFSELYSGISILKNALEKNLYVESLNTYILVFAKYIQLANALEISYDEAYSYFTDMTISA